MTLSKVVTFRNRKLLDLKARPCIILGEVGCTSSWTVWSLSAWAAHGSGSEQVVLCLSEQGDPRWDEVETHEMVYEWVSRIFKHPLKNGIHFYEIARTGGF